MLMGPDLEQRAQYLSLAFFAQGVIDDLLAILEQSSEPKPRSEIERALRSLQAVEAMRLNEDLPAFGTYEEIRTLYEVAADDQKRAKIVNQLESILLADTKGAVRGEAEELLDFFTNLASQALKNYAQADDQVPAGVLALCKPT